MCSVCFFLRNERVKLFADISKEAVVTICYVGTVLIEILYRIDGHHFLNH